jgi:type 1 glutamine amidotransferase
MPTALQTFTLAIAAAVCLLPGFAHADKPTEQDDSQAINVLLITSGCCHDYDFQAKAMQLAFQQRGVKANWTVVNEGGKGTEAEIDFYKNEDWAKGFDVVVHNECFAKTTNADYIRSITAKHHTGVNAVVIHCAMHTYRDATIDDWREFLGVTSRRHDHQSHYAVNVKAADHAIMKGYPDGEKSAKDELYIIEKTWPNTTVLATSKSERDGKEHPVFWTNTYGKARVFGTTYGHSNETFQNKTFLDTLTNGTLWAAGKLAAKKK